MKPKATKFKRPADRTWHLAGLLFLGFPILLFGLPQWNSNGNLDSEERLFSLTVHEHRREEKPVATGAELMSIEFESELTLFGHLSLEGKIDTSRLMVFNDSIQFLNILPFRFETFMSRDTLHYSSESGPKVASPAASELYDSMLSCLFTGPSLEIRSRPISPRTEILHLKEKCQSGEYTRLDLPTSAGLFFVDEQPALMEKDYQWGEITTIPPYSGLGFRPVLLVSGRVVQVTENEVTAVLFSDTTLENVQTTLPNGEKTSILSENIHLGGTLVLDIKNGFPVRGEVRIEESIRYIRPRISLQSLEKDCAYILRLRTY